MIKSITIVSDRNRAIEFDLQHPEKSGFAVINIDGLGPTKNKIAFSSSNSSNIKHEKSIPELRNINIKLRYYGVPENIDEYRHRLYDYFGAGRMIKVIIRTFEKKADHFYKTNGYVESLDPSIFSKEQEYDMSILCDSPYFKNPNQIDADILLDNYVKNKVFEFPFSNPVDDKTLEFSELVPKLDNEQLIIENKGDVDIGFEIQFLPYYKDPSIDKYVLSCGQSGDIIFDAKILSSINSNIKNQRKDRIYINTNEGKRKIVYHNHLSGNNYEKIDITSMMYLTMQKKWPKLVSGENYILLIKVPFTIPGTSSMYDEIDFIKGEYLYSGV